MKVGDDSRDSAGTVYASGDVEDKLMLLAFDREGHSGSRAIPTIDGRHVYLLSGTGGLGCLDGRSGEPRWSRDTREFGGSSGGWGSIYGNDGGA